jgi:hypothetical protein
MLNALSLQHQNLELLDESFFVAANELLLRATRQRAWMVTNRISSWRATAQLDEAEQRIAANVALHSSTTQRQQEGVVQHVAYRGVKRGREETARHVSPPPSPRETCAPPGDAPISGTTDMVPRTAHVEVLSEGARVIFAEVHEHVNTLLNELKAFGGPLELDDTIRVGPLFARCIVRTNATRSRRWFAIFLTDQSVDLRSLKLQHDVHRGYVARGQTIPSWTMLRSFLAELSRRGVI